ncbi:hypothetical protein [Candidatus Igneacidithiobacillus taiwanensis]|uniref:hypothetical protein n=1 Tax=Candidatus Igneacidithiobacillus taiwanensis TaxID=1945924 RepID=UPI0028A2B3EA|nr:hypothetical protein [Candidatus Igneacidithiobacillus taiwanensis]
MQQIGILIRPNGAELPILRMDADGTILVQGTYVQFETTIRTAIRSGYELTRAIPDLQDAWETARERSYLQPGVCHA